MGWLSKNLGFTKTLLDPAGVGQSFFGANGNKSGAGPTGNNWWDSIGKDGPDDLTKKRIGEIYRLFGEAGSDTALGGAKAAAMNRKKIPLINEAFDKSTGSAMTLAERSKKTLLENQPGRVAAGNQELGSRGLGNSNLARLQERGIRGDTTRSLQSIDDFFSDRVANLETQRATALSDVYGRGGQIEQGAAGEQAQLKAALAQMISQFQQAPKKPSGVNQALGVAADAAPLLALL